MTVPIGIIIFFCVYKLSDTRHIESSSARYFSFVGHSQLSRVEFQRYIFWILSAGTWLSIGCGFECCLHLLKADRWPQLSSRLLDSGCLFKFMNSSISYTHSDFLLELSEFPSSKSCQVPKTLKFQKLSSSKNSRVPKVVEFQKLSSSKSYQVPKTLEFQKLSSSKSCRVPKTLKFQKLSSSKNSRVPKVVEFQKLSSSKNSRVPKTLEFQKQSGSILQNSSSKILLSSNELSSIIQNFSSNLLLCCIHSSSIFRTRVPKYFSNYTHFLGSRTIQVPRNSTSSVIL